MPIRNVGEYLNCWSFTSQKPLRKGYEQNPKLVQKWLDEQYPVIAARAKQEGDEINWGDETGLCSDSQHCRSYATTCKTPAIQLNAKKGKDQSDILDYKSG
jgi:hypothetical protein